MVETSDAKTRLDALIRKARTYGYKPIQIAEILFRDRNGGDIDLSKKGDYRRPSTRWRNKVVRQLIGRTPQLNSRYEDQLFDENILPPAKMVELGEINKNHNGLVEAYIYLMLAKTTDQIAEIKAELKRVSPREFNLAKFLGYFEQDVLRRSIDKAYEIVVYALFSAITRHLDATVTLSVGSQSNTVLQDFEDFARLLLGVDLEHPKISLPAKLYRVGATNVNDTGLDMWANFGPAVQVKHITLSPDSASDIMGETIADQIVIVCKHAEREIIQTVLEQLGMAVRLRGIITEHDLLRWYGISFGSKYADSVGRDLLSFLIEEFSLEFPFDENIKSFLQERNYSSDLLIDGWEV